MPPTSDDDSDKTVFRVPRPAGAPPPVNQRPGSAVPVADAHSPSIDSSFGVPASAPAGNALPLGTRLGEFTLTRVIGEGGFGIVYEADDTALERRVAIKEYFPADLAERTGDLRVACFSSDDTEVFEKGLESFVNEAKILAQFDHPSLVKVYRFWEANGTAYMVMPCYEGRTLGDALRRLTAPPDERWLLQLLDPLTEALAVIHERRVYHRDIAPDNILLLAGTGAPLLLDFGAARRVIGDAGNKDATAMVKPGYAPLEQYPDVALPQGPWSDVYALAAVLHLAIAGKKPPAAISRIAGDRHVPLTTLAAGRYSANLLGAIDRGLTVQPGERLRSMDDFRAAAGLSPLLRDGAGTLMMSTRTRLDAAAAGAGASPQRPAGGGTPNEPDTTVVRRALRRDRRVVRWAQGITAVALLLAGAGAAVWWFGGAAPGVDAGGATAGAVGAAGAAPGTAAAPSTDPTSNAPAPATAPATSVGTAPTTDPTASPTAPAANPGPGATDIAAPGTAPSPTAPPAPPATPATPATTPVAPAFNVLDEFDRIAARSSPGRQVAIQWKRPSFRIGQKDLLALTVTSSHAGFVYVLAYTPDEVLFQYLPNDLTPVGRIGPQAPLAVPRTVVDPASKVVHEGVVMTEPPGRGHVLVIVSRHPRDFSPLGSRKDSIYRVLPVGLEAQTLRRQAAGDASIYLGRPICPPGTACVDEYAARVEAFDVVP